jgi:hypothetical protein
MERSGVVMATKFVRMCESCILNENIFMLSVDTLSLCKKYNGRRLFFIPLSF